MSVGAVNWPLVVDLLKAIAAPIAAVIIAFRAASTYRTQKRVDRELTWYEDMTAVLRDMAQVYYEFSRIRPLGRPDALAQLETRGRQVITAFQTQLDRGFLFGSQASLVRLSHLNSALGINAVRVSQSQDMRYYVNTALEAQQASVTLANEMRRVMGAPKLSGEGLHILTEEDVRDAAERAGPPRA